MHPRQRRRFLLLLAALQHWDILSGATVQPRQGRVKVARQELPGKQKDEGESRQGRLIARIFSRPCRDSVVLVFYPGSSCRATFTRPCRGWPVFMAGHLNAANCQQPKKECIYEMGSQSLALSQ